MHWLRVLRAFTMLDLRLSFFKKFYVLMELFSIALTLLIYYYSSLAFEPSDRRDLNFFGTNLFAYLFWGDILLRFPQSLFYSPVNNLKVALQDQTFESMIVQADSVRKILLGLSIMHSFREFLSIVVILTMAMVFFNVSLPLPTLLKVVLMTVAFLPFFLGIGFFINALVLVVQKGESMVHLISNLLAILAGMYFPVEVFPQFIQRMAQFISPFSFFLQMGRKLLQTGELDYATLLLSFICGIIVCALGLEAVLWIYRKRKALGEPPIIY